MQASVALQCPAQQRHLWRASCASRACAIAGRSDADTISDRVHHLSALAGSSSRAPHRLATETSLERCLRLSGRYGACSSSRTSRPLSSDQGNGVSSSRSSSSSSSHLCTAPITHRTTAESSTRRRRASAAGASGPQSFFTDVDPEEEPRAASSTRTSTRHEGLGGDEAVEAGGHQARDQVPTPGDDDGGASTGEPAAAAFPFARPLNPLTDEYTDSTSSASGIRLADSEAFAGAESFYEPLPAPGAPASSPAPSGTLRGMEAAYSPLVDESVLETSDEEALPDLAAAEGGDEGGEMTAEERQRLAAEWGFDHLGELMPEGVRPEAIEERLPPQLLEQDPMLAVRGLLLPLAVMAAAYWWLWFSWGMSPWWQAPLTWLAWLAIGTAYTGLFSVAHHCAHYAFLPSNLATQDVLGMVLMAPSLYAFEPWRVRFFAHLAFCNMLHEDTLSAWHPLTDEALAEMGVAQRFGAWLMLATPLKLWSSIGHWLSTWDGLDLKASREESRAGTLLSWLAPVAFAGVAWSLLIGAGGLAAWASCWLAPWLVFHAWLSVLSLVQHTAPHIPFRPHSFDYDLGQAIISGTVTVRLPRALEVLLNNANYHLYEHVSFRVPFYHAREAHEWLRGRLGTYMTEATANLTLLKNLIFEWQVYDTSWDTYRRFDEVWGEILSLEEAAVAAARESGSGGQQAVQQQDDDGFDSSAAPA